MTPTAETITNLRAGLGVEDIAVTTGRCVTAIRAEVAQLRATGVLPGLWPGECHETAQTSGEKGVSRGFAGAG